MTLSFLLFHRHTTYLPWLRARSLALPSSVGQFLLITRLLDLASPKAPSLPGGSAAPLGSQHTALLCLVPGTPSPRSLLIGLSSPPGDCFIVWRMGTFASLYWKPEDMPSRLDDSARESRLECHAAEAPGAQAVQGGGGVRGKRSLLRQEEDSGNSSSANELKSSTPPALARWLSGFKHRLMYQNVVGLILARAQTSAAVSILARVRMEGNRSMFPSLPSSCSKTNVSCDGDEKERKKHPSHAE